MILGIRGYKRFDKDNYAALGTYKCSKCEHIYDPEKDGEGKNFEDLSSLCDMAFGKPWKCPECGTQISAYKPIKSDSESEDEAGDGICALTGSSSLFILISMLVMIVHVLL